MAVRQYIGARYVTKIYENSLDPSSAEWEADVTYEPLTMVTYLNSSYLSKKDVPGSIGNPAENPSYWVVTGAYNGQILNLQNQIDTINNVTIPAIDAHIEDIDDELDLLSSLFVDVRDYGAKLDGVTDDSSAFNDALAAGNILLPKNSTVYLANKVSVPPSRIIDGNWSTFTGANGSILFEIKNWTDSGPSSYYTVKNMFIDAVSGCTPFVVRNVYNVEFDNIRIIKIQANTIGFDVTDVFNVVFKRCWAQGDASDTYVSGCTAISIATDTNDNGITSTYNVTNIAMFNCLLQRCENGVHIHRKASIGNFEDINMYNMGFSFTKKAINIDNAYATEVNINDIRVEYTEIALHNESDYVKLCGASGYSVDYLVDNTGYLLLGSSYINNSALGHTGYVIKSNTGTIYLMGARNSGISESEYVDNTKIGIIINKPYYPSPRNVPYNTQIPAYALRTLLINFTGGNNISNIEDLFEGLNFDFIVTSGGFTIAGETITDDGKLHHAAYIGGTWYIS